MNKKKNLFSYFVFSFFDVYNGGFWPAITLQKKKNQDTIRSLF